MRTGEYEDRETRLTNEVPLLAEVSQSLQLVLRQIALRLSQGFVQSLLSSEHPVRSRVDDGKLQQVQSGS